MSVETGKQADAARPLGSPDPDAEGSGAEAVVSAVSADTVESVAGDSSTDSEIANSDTADNVGEVDNAEVRRNRENTGADADTSDSAAAPEFSGRRSRISRIVLGAAAVVLIAALAAAVWFGTGWVRAAVSDGPRADARDAALDGARQAALNLTAMNIDDVPGSLALARSSMTGALLDSANKNKDQSEKLATDSATNMRAKVLGAGLTSLDSEENQASALVVLQVTETGRDKPPADYRYTWDVRVTKDGDVWKADQISSLGQPVSLSGGEQGAQPGAQEPASGAPDQQVPDQQAPDEQAPADQQPAPAQPGS